MEDKIDRFGLCPNCKKSWDGKDILQVLSSMSCNSGKSYIELVKLSSNYGWTEINKTHFSTLISHELEDGRNLLECPNISCQHVFDRYTGVEYSNMFDAKRNIPILKQGEFPTNNKIPLTDPSNYRELKIVTDFQEKELHITKENRQEVELEIHKNLQNKILSVDNDEPF